MPTRDDYREDPDAVARLDPLSTSVDELTGSPRGREPHRGARGARRQPPRPASATPTAPPRTGTAATRDRQGDDRGSSYRSSPFTVDDEQRRTTFDTIADVDASRLWPGPVVTRVTPASEFREAEPEHQDYLERTPGGCTCHFARPGWRLLARVQNPT